VSHLINRLAGLLIGLRTRPFPFMMVPDMTGPV